MTPSAGAARKFPATALTGPYADGLDLPYWEGLRAGELRLQRCAECDLWIWGPRWMCGRCQTFDPEWVAVEPVGRVFSWSRTWHPFIPELAGELPYVTVLVELPHAGGRRVLGLLAESGDTDIAIGDAVAGIIQQPSEAPWPLLRWQRAHTSSETERGAQR
ncbi:DNA-binding protein [Rhodococcus sp. ACS1]|uniref:Zn-ribbon domain-containing OB-fold protein n=1 Tax=Rhodococcus sp. ACS1 TaxID=2028570 RepID=UPI000BB0D598|nr:OB-fold domain-containing protein [Rhodococcus sp. ACS1]PBC51968.1 DNA-binding protein [Rhodococcus sp. ACS1]